MATATAAATAATTIVEYAQVKKYSIDSALGSVSPGHAISSSPSPAPSGSSLPSSPIHTEDEKQENEATEKAEKRHSDDEEEHHIVPPIRK